MAGIDHENLPLADNYSDVASGSCWISYTPSANLVTFLPDWPHTGVAAANNPSTRASTNSRT
jgi:hypothetical protein